MTVTVSDRNGIPDLVRRLEDLSRYEVQIGVFGDDDKLLMIASVHEFGTSIRVTPAMRGYLHSIGIHLRADTDQIHIPERSFIRAGFDTNQSRINRVCDSLLDRVIQGEIDVPTMYNAIGAEITGLIQGHLTDLRDPPLHPATSERKGADNPLIDTGQLRSSITWKVVSS